MSPPSSRMLPGRPVPNDSPRGPASNCCARTSCDRYSLDERRLVIRHCRSLANLKLGAQYTIYTRFNDGTENYDGSCRDGSDNDTLFLYAWLAF
jgi:hypothetical protein